jgi:RNA polymerase sigma-70 factor (ECF subfamily)
MAERARRTDLQLLEAWRGGDTAAGRVLVDRHLPALYRFFISKLGNDADAEDLVADTIETLLGAIERFREASSFRTFLFGIAHNLLRNFVRKRKRRGEDKYWGEVSAEELGPGPSTILSGKLRERGLVRALRTLPLELQAIIELSYVEELSRSEIAEITGLPPGTVASRLRRARKLLESALEHSVPTEALLRTSLAGLENWALEVRLDSEES